MIAEKTDTPLTEEYFYALNVTATYCKEFVKDGGWQFRQTIEKSGYDVADFLDVPFTKVESYNHWTTYCQLNSKGETFGVCRRVDAVSIREHFADE